jgi:hypothetical protein
MMEKANVSHGKTNDGQDGEKGRVTLRLSLMLVV